MCNCNSEPSNDCQVQQPKLSGVLSSCISMRITKLSEVLSSCISAHELGAHELMMVIMFAEHYEPPTLKTLNFGYTTCVATPISAPLLKRNMQSEPGGRGIGCMVTCTNIC